MVIRIKNSYCMRRFKRRGVRKCAAAKIRQKFTPLRWPRPLGLPPYENVPRHNSNNNIAQYIKSTGAYSRHFHHRCLFLTQGEKWVTGAYSRHFHGCLLPDAGIAAQRALRARHPAYNNRGRGTPPRHGRQHRDNTSPVFV